MAKKKGTLLDLRDEENFKSSNNKTVNKKTPRYNRQRNMMCQEFAKSYSIVNVPTIGARL